MKNIILTDLKFLNTHLNRTPTRIEFLKYSNISRRAVNKVFGTYTEALIAADIKPIKSLSLGVSQVSCKYCNKSFEKTNQNITKTNNNFCSRSCAATYNNKNRILDKTFRIEKRRFFPKLTPNYIYLKSFVICGNCNNTYNKIGTRIANNNTCSILCHMELGMKNRIMKDSIKRTGANTYDALRQNARAYSKHIYPPLCMICGYDKHYEVCHVKDLKDFTREETFFEVNNKTNLIHLCSNCHWEFDKGLILIQEIIEAQNNECLL